MPSFTLRQELQRAIEDEFIRHDITGRDRTGSRQRNSFVVNSLLDEIERVVFRGNNNIAEVLGKLESGYSLIHPDDIPVYSMETLQARDVALEAVKKIPPAVRASGKLHQAR